MFLKKVKRDSEEQRWQARGGDEHIYRKVYVMERMRWKEYQERTARLLQPSVDEELELWMDGKLPLRVLPFRGPPEIRHSSHQYHLAYIDLIRSLPSSPNHMPAPR